MNDFLTYASVLFLTAAALLSGWLFYMVVRKKPPFKPGTEPKHSWDMTRAERVEQIRADIARRRDEALEKDAEEDEFAVLNTFNPIAMYPAYEGMPVLTGEEALKEKVRNVDLISAMTFNDALHSEMLRAVRHSRVLLDAQKHHLNYKQSEVDNGIEALERKYLLKDVAG